MNAICPKCGRYTFFAGDIDPSLLCRCGTTTALPADIRYVLVNDPSLLSQRDEAISQRDEARYWARKLYKRLGDEHIARISAEAVANYWSNIRGPALQQQNDELRRVLGELHKERDKLLSIASTKIVYQSNDSYGSYTASSTDTSNPDTTGYID